MSLKKCKYCEADLTASTVYCPKCGGKLKPRLRDVVVMGFIGVICLMFAGCFALAWVAENAAQEADKQRAIDDADQIEARIAVIKAEQARQAEKMVESIGKTPDEAAAVEAKDADSRAIAALKLQIESGSVAAKYSLAVRYLEGSGVAKDEAKAVALLKECAAKDHFQAKQQLQEMGR